MTDLMTLPQGDVRLLDTDLARELLASTELARMAYVAKDGTPRVFPMMFKWDGEELVFATFEGAQKIRALRARPDVAVTIDRPGPPSEILLLRGRAEVTEVDGLVPEYVWIHHHYYGPEQGARNIAGVEQMGLRMARVAVRPAWVGLIDFQTRMPAPLGGPGA
jgi:PPOX class probable F420-dependent enzyme